MSNEVKMNDAFSSGLSPEEDIYEGWDKPEERQPRVSKKEIEKINKASGFTAVPASEREPSIVTSLTLFPSDLQIVEDIIDMQKKNLHITEPRASRSDIFRAALRVFFEDKTAEERAEYLKIYRGRGRK